MKKEKRKNGKKRGKKNDRKHICVSITSYDDKVKSVGRKYMP